MLALDIEKEIELDFPGLLPELDKLPDRTSRVRHIFRRAYTENLTDVAADSLVLDAYTLSLWRQHRTVYRFEQELFYELCLQARRADANDLLPADLLRNLPFPCIQVEGSPIHLKVHDSATGEPLADIPVTGRFFAYIQPKGEVLDDYDCLTTVWETGRDGHLAAYMLPISGTLRESTEALMDFLREQNPGEDLHPNTATNEIILPMMAAQIILYLQATNADIQRRPSQQRKKKAGQKKPAQKPAKVADVGVHIAAAIRSARQRSEAGPSREGSSTAKRPHARRAHWHTYLAGPRDGEQKRVVRWVSATFIHADQKQGTTVVPVKK